MTHLSMDILVALRDRSSEPGTAAASEHLSTCAVCQAEFAGLHQRVAQLRALPTLHPARDLWPAVAFQARRGRNARRRMAIAGVAGLAMAASLAIVVVTRQPSVSEPAVASVSADRISQAQERSRELEQALKAYPDSVHEAGAASIAHAMEARIAEVDRAIARAEASERQGQAANVLQLWQEKVGLLDALVNVHVSRASHVEF